MILQNVHEVTPLIKISKLQMLASRFKDLRMMEHETISDFNSKLCDIATMLKAFKTTWSDDDSDESGDTLSNYVIFQATIKKLFIPSHQTLQQGKLQAQNMMILQYVMN